MAQPNGATEIKIADIPDRQVLEIILEVLQQLTEQVSELKLEIQEVREGLSNLSTPGLDYNIEDE